MSRAKRSRVVRLWHQLDAYWLLLSSEASPRSLWGAMEQSGFHEYLRNGDKPLCFYPTPIGMGIVYSNRGHLAILRKMDDWHTNSRRSAPFLCIRQKNRRERITFFPACP